MNKKLIVTLGMHRSGTSAVTRGLSVLGVDLGDRLMPSLAGVNEKGFWEDTEVVALNEEILHAVGSAWDAVSEISDQTLHRLAQNGYLERAVGLLTAKVASTPLFGLKDPRLCKLLPFWQDVFERCQLEASYVVSIRNPASVKNSLVKRDGFSPEKCYYIWLDHVLESITNSQVIASSVIVDYDRLLDDPDNELAKIARRFDLSVDADALQVYRDEFLESGLRHSVHGSDDLAADPACPRQVYELYNALLNASENAAGLSDERLQRLALQYREECHIFSPLLRLTDTLVQEQRRLEAEQRITLQQAAEQADIRLRSELDGLRRIRRERGDEIEHLTKLRQREVSARDAEIAQRDQVIAGMAGELHALRSSTSWRLTGPVRKLSTQARRARQASRLFGTAVSRQGVLPAAKGAVSAVSLGGVAGLKKWLSSRDQVSHQVMVQNHGTPVYLSPGNSFRPVFRPYYLNPFFDIDSAAVGPSSMAVHVYVDNGQRLDEVLSHLANVPYAFDLYVSNGLGATVDLDALKAHCASEVRNAKAVVVQNSPEHAGAIASMLLSFGRRLAGYPIIGHFHTGQPDTEIYAEVEWRLLLGDKGSNGKEVAQIIDLLSHDTTLVCAESDLSRATNESPWLDRRMAAAEILRKYTGHEIESLSVDEVPSMSMFWARRDAISEFLELPLKEKDAVPESDARIGALEFALSCSLPLFAMRSQGFAIQLFERDSTEEYPFREEQIDFSAELTQDAPKILAYYLPQFHPIPENDEWHGVGFTEWTKVRTANPLFPTHYQQHVPHEDIGYYLLDTPVTLTKQAEMMKRAGVHGQIFYHYWFGGKLILEKPARMLLDNSDIEMPFCFCWANENWTRRWDGEEHNVLLGQNYSAEDASAFIQYLIPFFKDRRYITVDGRPVLFVYRPSSMPDAHLYVRIWHDECKKAGLPAPYVVAVLTRGATDPSDFGMDAGTERVLHDWTGGAVADITQEVQSYTPLSGKVIDYSQVADFYMSQSPARTFPYFRSLVPIWDNTARYGEGAYVVHASNPAKFQEWMESLLEQAKNNLSSDKRFVLVNAWNEWAEGAHLEPDTRYGYAYLNSVGRALTGKPFGWRPEASKDELARLKVHIEITSVTSNALLADALLRERFLACLSQSTLLQNCNVSTESRLLFDGMGTNRTHLQYASNIDADYVIRVGDVSYFSANTLEQLVLAAEESKTSVIIANAYGNGQEIIPITKDGSISRRVAADAPLAVYPSRCGGTYRNFRVCSGARCFVAPPFSIAADNLPVVTTIMRFHSRGELGLLGNALWCLVAMKDCIVRPFIAAQDLSDQQKVELEQLLASYPWAKSNPPIIRYFESEAGRGDLRAVMLNESLKSVGSGYVGFLDYDDLLFPSAYQFLLGRLKQTGKSATFGRVYASLYDNRSARIVERRRIFEYGRSYADFVAHNHAPLHSFLLHLDGINLVDIVYYHDQKYMEDYLLTLQIFSPENTDWDVLDIVYYIGDYSHSVDRGHTLALVDDTHRGEVAKSDLYRRCETRILDMKKSRSELFAKNKNTALRHE
jgi:lipopolysaccharide biosynthesis protein